MRMDGACPGPTMDRVIAGWADEAIADGDLMLCPSRGVAWQADLTITASYDQAYFDKYRGYEDQPIGQAINAGRVALVDRHVGSQWLLDVGVGSGEFIRARGANTFGYDVNPAAETWLRAEGLWAGPDAFGAFRAFSFWDVLEHVPDPDVYLGQMVAGDHVFVSIPVFESLSRIRVSRHYRPGEHLYYFTRRGFIDWMASKGFMHLETNWYEVDAGRDSIAAFAFLKVA